MELSGTRTEKNLMTAFAGESQARNRYTYFSSVAKKAGLEQIAAVFLETADNEKEHAKRFYGFLTEGCQVGIQASFPKVLGSTPENLKEAAAGEHMEWKTLYPEFARVAAEEGFAQIAEAFRRISIAERQHEKRYLGLLQNLVDDKVFQKDSPVVWKCRNCGYVHEGTRAPEVCPACQHPKAHFELLAENW